MGSIWALGALLLFGPLAAGFAGLAYRGDIAPWSLGVAALFATALAGTLLLARNLTPHFKSWAYHCRLGDRCHVLRELPRNCWTCGRRPAHCHACGSDRLPEFGRAGPVCPDCLAPHSPSLPPAPNPPTWLPSPRAPRTCLSCGDSGRWGLALSNSPLAPSLCPSCGHITPGGRP